MPLSELLALWLDGQVYRLGDVFALPDLPETAELRAAAFAATSPGGAIADRGTAAWIHGTRGRPPARAQVCTEPGRRGPRIPHDVDARQALLADGDVVSIGGVEVTSPMRTAFDLLIASARFSAEDACEVRRLLLMGGSTPFALRERLAGRRQPGTARARQHLDDVERVRLDADEEARLRPLQPPLTR